MRLVLNEQHFRDLVAGRVVEVRGYHKSEDLSFEVAVPVSIILSDIGFPLMIQAVQDALAAAKKRRGANG